MLNKKVDNLIIIVSLLIFGFICGGIFSTVNSQFVPTVQQLPDYKSDWEKELYIKHTEVNLQLKRDIELELGACNRASFLFENNQWSHEYFKDQALSWTTQKRSQWGENLSKDFDNTLETFESWQNSVEHNKNISDISFKSLGVCRVGNITVAWFSN